MLTIRPATSTNAAALTRLAVETFTDTYATQNTPENMANYLADYFSETQIGQELADPNALYLLAFWEENMVGYVKLRSGHEPPELDGTRAIEIERIYVLQAFHQHKIGYALMQHALQAAKEKGFEAVWLGVWTENPRAIAFYQKVGFEIFGTHEFVLGDDRQEDYMMVKWLNG